MNKKLSGEKNGKYVEREIKGFTLCQRIERHNDFCIENVKTKDMLFYITMMENFAGGVISLS